MFNCAGCIFANLDSSGEQTGCKASRLEKLPHQATDDGFYALDKFCNMNRGEEWAEHICNPKYDGYEPVHIARREVEPTFGIIVYDDSNVYDDILTTLDSIQSLDYNKRKMTIVWSMTEDVMKAKNMAIIDAVQLVQTIKADGYKIWLNLHQDITDVTNRDKECFSKVVGMSHWVKITGGTRIPLGLFHDIDSSVNDEMKSIALFENKKQNVSVIPSSVARLKYLDYNEYGLMVKGIREEAKEEKLYIEINETK